MSILTGQHGDNPTGPAGRRKPGSALERSLMILFIAKSSRCFDCLSIYNKVVSGTQSTASQTPTYLRSLTTSISPSFSSLALNSHVKFRP